jgi:hypothetical protein
MAYTDPAFLQFVERRRLQGQPNKLLWTDVTPTPLAGSGRS